MSLAADMIEDGRLRVWTRRAVWVYECRMRYALALVAVMLLAAGAFLGWSAFVIGARAFEEHADSVPGVYLTAGVIYGLLSISSLIAAYYAGTRAWARIRKQGTP